MFEHNEDLFLTRAEFDAGVFGRANPPSFPAGPQVAVTKAISVAWLCHLRVTCIQVCELGEGKSVSHAMERFRRQVWTCPSLPVPVHGQNGPDSSTGGLDAEVLSCI